MKATTFLAVALSAAVASAQLDQIPPCALACATQSLGETGCGLTDIACICRAEAFIQGLLPCVQQSCNEAGQLDETIAAAAGLCLQAGVTLSIPTGPTATETSTTSVASTTDTVTTTETSASTTATETETETETTAAPTTGTNTSATTPPVPTGTDDSGAARNAIAFGAVALGLVAALL